MSGAPPRLRWARSAADDMWMLLLVARLAGLAGPLPGCGANGPEIVIRNVHLIELETGSTTRHVSIVVSDGRICRIDPTRHARSSRSGSTIDGRGRFVLPGFTAAGLGDEQKLLGFGVTQITANAAVRADEPDDDVHEQIARWVADGSTPLQALQRVAANRLAAGGDATLLLLERDPRENIANTRSISLVMLHGRPLGLRTLARARAGREIELQPFGR
jgi:predicted amidohydrolase YtcJ